MTIFRILLSNAIYPNSSREKHSIVTHVHFPKQFLLSSSTAKYTWPYRSSVDSYKMRFHVSAVEVYKQRNTQTKICNDHWREYDNWVARIHKMKTRCNNPYQDKDRSLPMCYSKEDMAQSMFFTNMNERHKYGKPCKVLGNIRTEVIESTIKNTKNRKIGEFWFSINISQNIFKQVYQTRYFLKYISF